MSTEPSSPSSSAPTQFGAPTILGTGPLGQPSQLGALTQPAPFTQVGGLTQPMPLGPSPSPSSSSSRVSPPTVSGASGRPSVMQLVFREKGALYAAYMPLLAEGGVFVPTAREYHLGDDIYLLLSLPDDPQRYPVAGRVAWITPANVSGGRTQGVGVAFPADEKTAVLRARIEEILGTQISSQKPTQTV